MEIRVVERVGFDQGCGSSCLAWSAPSQDVSAGCSFLIASLRPVMASTTMFPVSASIPPVSWRRALTGSASV